MSILIDNGRITTLPAAGQGPGDAQVIDCGGRVVIPGLIDTHWQATLASVSQIVALTQDIGFLHLMAGQEAGETLMRGFITLCDVGGSAFGRKAATDRGVVTGPRIFPAGAIISQTSGHGNFRFQNSLPMMPGDPADYASRQGMSFLADEDANQYTDIKAVAAQRAVAEGTARASEWADKHRVNRAFGTDILYGRGESQGRQLAKLARFMSPLSALHRVTGDGDGGAAAGAVGRAGALWRQAGGPSTRAA